jgi:hypothetical protein
MSVQVVVNSNSYLGATIQEKTRTILGWTTTGAIVDQNSRPSPTSPMVLAVRRQQQHRTSLPYTSTHRIRKSSASSSSSDSIPSSPSSSCHHRKMSNCCSEPMSPSTKCQRDSSEVFERLRQLVPELPADRNAYQMLIEIQSHVIDLEHELEQLSEKTERVRQLHHHHRGNLKSSPCEVRKIHKRW